MHQHAAGLGVALAGQGLDQLALAVARDAGDADDLAGADFERQLAPPRAGRYCRRPHRPSILSTALPGARASRSTVARVSRRPTIISAMVSLSSSAVGRVPTSLPRRSTVTVSQKAFTSRNLWVMVMMVIFRPR